MPATMPLKLVRLIAVVVALVVPLQGMAALAASQCMALGHHEAPAMHHDAQAAHADGHDHDSHAASGDPDASDEADGSHCGPCTACCASASIAGPSALVIEPDTFSAPYAFVSQPPVRLAPDELDRPPLPL
jgi:hypothetical protein